MTRGTQTARLGLPHLHFNSTDSTNIQAKRLAAAGAPIGTLVTAGQQSAGRGRQRRQWWSPPGGALLCSLIMPAEQPLPLSILAAIALCDALGEQVGVKWPNDIVLPDRSGRLGKLAGILVEGRPQAGWMILGIGVNVAVKAEQAPPQLQESLASLNRPASAIAPLLEAILIALQTRSNQQRAELLAAYGERDLLRDRSISWSLAPGADGACAPRPERQPLHAGRAEATVPQAETGQPPSRRRATGVAEGIDELGRLLVRGDEGQLALSAGEVHLAGDR